MAKINLTNNTNIFHISSSAASSLHLSHYINLSLSPKKLKYYASYRINGASCLVCFGLLCHCARILCNEYCYYNLFISNNIVTFGYLVYIIRNALFEISTGAKIKEENREKWRRRGSRSLAKQDACVVSQDNF